MSRWSVVGTRSKSNDEARTLLREAFRTPADPEDVKRFETVCGYLFCMKVWSGLLIQAMVGICGGWGRLANRDGFASNAAVRVSAR